MEIITISVAIYGAVLSTGHIVWSFLRERRAIRVGLSTGSPDNYAKRLEPCVTLRATNTGHRPVIITDLGFNLPTGERYLPKNYTRVGSGNTGLPKTLSDGESAHLSIYCHDIGLELMTMERPIETKLTPVAIDSIGGVHKGKPWRIDPREFVVDTGGKKR